MKVIDKLKEMSAAEIAHYLRDVDIDKVVRWCGVRCPNSYRCFGICEDIDVCAYSTDEGDEKAWAEFLQMDITGDMEVIKLADLIEAVDARLNNGEDLPPMTAGDFIKLAKSQRRYKLDSTALVNL